MFDTRHFSHCSRCWLSVSKMYGECTVGLMALYQKAEVEGEPWVESPWDVKVNPSDGELSWNRNAIKRRGSVYQMKGAQHPGKIIIELVRLIE